MMAPDTLPVITLWQPWASLIFAGYKPDETRGFRYPAKYHERTIGIQAAATLPAMRHISEELADICYDAFGCGWNFSLPRGCILGTVKLIGCRPTTEIAPRRSDDQLATGDYSAGRHAWLLADIRALPVPVPHKGNQGWSSIAASELTHSEGA